MNGWKIPQVNKKLLQEKFSIKKVILDSNTFTISHNFSKSLL